MEATSLDGMMFLNASLRGFKRQGGGRGRGLTKEKHFLPPGLSQPADFFWSCM